MAKIKVLEQEITTVRFHDEDNISLTNIAKYKNKKEAGLNKPVSDWRIEI